jgi:hypothetical protein
MKKPRLAFDGAVDRNLSTTCLPVVAQAFALRM